MKFELIDFVKVVGLHLNSLQIIIYYVGCVMVKLAANEEVRSEIKKRGNTKHESSRRKCELTTRMN